MFLLWPCNIRLGDIFLFCMNANTTSYISDKGSEALKMEECDDFSSYISPIPLVSGAENFLSLQGELLTRVRRFIFLALRASHLASSQWPWHTQLLCLEGTSSPVPFPGKFSLSFLSQLICPFLQEALPPSNDIGLSAWNLDSLSLTTEHSILYHSCLSAWSVFPAAWENLWGWWEAFLCRSQLIHLSRTWNVTHT